MHETRYPERVSFRAAREAMDEVRRIARDEDLRIGAVLRRLLAKALKTEKGK